MVKEIKVFYDNNGLPYKDKELQVHFPIVGSAFQGASQSTEIKFYTDNILSDESSIWFAVSKLPNGQTGYTVLQNGSDSDGNYYLLKLTSFHTQYKGDVYINLQAYAGGVEFDEDDETFIPVGVPIIYVSGSIKLAINYATGIIDGGEIDINTWQELVSYLSNYLRIDSPKYFKVISAIAKINDTENEEINEETGTRFINVGDIVYAKSEKCFYYIDSGTYPSLSYQAIELQLPEAIIQALEVSGTLTVQSFANIVDSNGKSLNLHIKEMTFDKVPEVSSTSMYGLLIGAYGYKKVICSNVDDVITFLFLENISGDSSNVLVHVLDKNGYRVYRSNITTTIKTPNQTIVAQKPFDNAVILSSLPTTLTAEQQMQVAHGNAYIIHITDQSYEFYYKLNESTSVGSGAYQFIKVGSPTSGSGVIRQLTSVIFVDKSSFSVTKVDYDNQFYNKDKVDSLIADILRNAYTLVDTETYPTLEAFLESTGQEGYIYLYPVDLSDETKGYYQYIYEETSDDPWISLGTTAIDLSDYYTKSEINTYLGGKVDKTQTVAGIALSGNVSAADIQGALFNITAIELTERD